MNITVNVDEVSLRSVVGHGLAYDDDGEPRNGAEIYLGDVVARQIVDRLVRDQTTGYDDIRQRVRAIRDEEIRAAITPLIREAIDRPIQPTNAYGDPKGAPTTLAEVIVAEAQAFMSRPANTGYNSNGQTPLAAMVAAEVKAAFQDTVKETVAAARAAVTKEIADQFTAGIAPAIRAGLAR